jgi:hypothetical protein
MIKKNDDCESSTCGGNDFWNAAIHNLWLICYIVIVNRTCAQNCPRKQQSGISQTCARVGILLQNNNNAEEEVRTTERLITHNLIFVTYGSLLIENSSYMIINLFVIHVTNYQ